MLWARQQRTLTDLADLELLGAKAGRPQFAQLELAGTCSISQLTATRLADDAHRMVHVLTRTLVQAEAGLLLRHQAEVLLTRTRHCTEQVAQAVEDEVLPVAASLCPSDLRKRVDRAVLRAESADPASAEQRHADAVAARRVYAKLEPDGMGLAGAVLPAPQLAAWTAGLRALERRERRADLLAGITRTTAQRTADLFAALPAMVLAGLAQDRAARLDPGLLAALAGRPLTTAPVAAGGTGGDSGGGSGGDAGCGSGDDAALGAALADAAGPWTLGAEQVAAQVVLNVHVPYSTVLDLSREPGLLEGHGPLSAEHVRLLRPNAYRQVVVDGRTGRPLALDDAQPAAPDPRARRRQYRELLRPRVVVDRDEPGHDPSARLARLVDLRDQHCCGPGCASTVTDRDHLVPHPEGPTSAANLGRLSRRCHRAKHHGWTLTRHPDGACTWHSPLGRTYRRPGPWSPPPATDLYQAPPTLRARPTAGPTPATGDDDPPDTRPPQRPLDGTSEPPGRPDARAGLPSGDPPPF